VLAAAESSAEDDEEIKEMHVGRTRACGSALYFPWLAAGETGRQL